MRTGLAALLLLGACAVGGPVPQPGGAPGAPLTIAGAGGRALALSAWGPAEPRAVILGVHGFGDHGASTFSRPAAAWARAEIRTYAHDQRGFGRNPSHGRWPGADRLIDDLVAVTRRLRARHPDVPLAVVGHSMGGGVALAAAPDLPADGLVLAAPAIWGGAALAPHHRAAAWLAAAAVPERRFTGAGLVRIRASDNTEVLRRLAADPLYLGAPSAREMLGLVRVMDRAAAAASRARLPALLLLGARDEIAPEAPVRAVFARLPGPRRVISYANGWHLLLRDRQAPRVWRDIAAWVRALPRPRPQPPSGRLQAMIPSAE